MAKASPAQLSFSAGEISPLAAARTDADQYKTGLKKCLNYVATAIGPATHRPGTYFAAVAKDSTKKTRVRRFEFSTEQAYVIEFGDLYCRFYKDNAQVTLTAQDITGITNANPAVLTYNGADTYANGDRVTIANVAGMTRVNNREFTVANVNVGANTFELSGVDSTAYGTWTSGGTVAEIYEIVTPYLEADLFALDLDTQSADVLYITHPSYAPRKLSRTAHTSWTLSTIDFLDGPYMDQNTTTTTLTPSAATGAGVTVTASAVTGINDDTGFQTTDVGRLIRIKETGVWGYVKITGRTSTTVVTVTVVKTLTNVDAKLDWRLGLWSDTTGYPGTSVFYEDRLVFGGATEAPGRIDGSKSGQYENFAPTATDGTVADSNAISYLINASSVNRIYWVADDENGLLIGSAGGCWAMRASTLNEALTPTNVSAKRFTGFGSKNMQPVRAGQSTVYAQREGRVLRAITYGTSKFAAKDVSIASSHITKTGLVELAYMQYPHETIWAVRTDGALLGVLYSKPEESADPAIIGWHRHVLGGAFGSGDAVVESATVIPSADGTFEQLWLVVKRTINGATVRTVEYMTNFFESDVDAIADAFFVDCGLTYDGAATTTVGGLWHLEGQTVTILADGATHPTKVVSNGTVTLDRSATKVHVGLYEDADIESLRFEDGARDGTAQGKTQRMTGIAVRLDNTVGLKYGPTFDDLDELPFRSSGDLTATAVPLFTGDKQLPFHGDYTTEARVCLRQHMPLPSTVVGIYPRLVTQDKG